MSMTGLLDPQFAEIVATYSGDHPDSLRAATPGTRPFGAGSSEDAARVSRTDVRVPGSPDVTIRIHRPIGVDSPLPCIVSLHSGGYVFGDVAMDEDLLDRWSAALPAVVVAVDYRLAPATPYPGPLTDCYTALTWVYEHADDHGIDRDRIGVHGIGAGGGLAAALALVARDHRDIPLAFQLLDSPMLDDRQQTHSSRIEGLPLWSADSTEAGWRAYLGDLYGAGDVPVYAAAGRCVKLRHLPPAFISVGGLDGFHDEDVDYATRLSHAGVPTELHVYPRAPHGYHLAPNSDVARNSARDQLDWLRRQFSH